MALTNDGIFQHVAFYLILKNESVKTEVGIYVAELPQHISVKERYIPYSGTEMDIVALLLEGHKYFGDFLYGLSNVMHSSNATISELTT